MFHTSWLGQWYGCIASCPTSYDAVSMAFPSTTVLSFLIAAVSTFTAAWIGLWMNDLKSFDDLGSLNPQDGGGSGSVSTAIPNQPWSLHFVVIAFQYLCQAIALGFFLYHGNGEDAHAFGVAMWLLHGVSCFALTLALHHHITRYGRRRNSVSSYIEMMDDDLSLPAKVVLRIRAAVTAPLGKYILLLVLYIAAGAYNEILDGAVIERKCSQSIDPDRSTYWLFIAIDILQRVPIYVLVYRMVLDKDITGRRDGGPSGKVLGMLVLSLVLELPCIVPNSLWSEFIAKNVARKHPCPLGVFSAYDIVLMLMLAGVILRYMFIRGEFQRNRANVLMRLYTACNARLDASTY